MKTKAEKDQDISALKEEFSKISNALVVSFQGLPVGKDWELRRAIGGASLNYRVIKNTLGRRAVEGTPLESLKDSFVGMTAVAYSENDPVGIAKVLSKFAKDNPQITFKAGVVEGRAINVKDIAALASMPSKEELVSKLMFLLNAPAQRTATVLNALQRNLAIVVSEIAKQKGSTAQRAEAVAEQATEQAAEPTAEQVAEPAVEPKAEPTTETTEPAAESVAEPVAEQTPAEA